MVDGYVKIDKEFWTTISNAIDVVTANLEQFEATNILIHIGKTYGIIGFKKTIKDALDVMEYYDKWDWNHICFVMRSYEEQIKSYKCIQKMCEDEKTIYISIEEYNKIMGYFEK